MEEVEDLSQSIKDEISSKRKYLDSCQNDRLKFDSFVRLVADWIKQAEQHLLNGNDGVEYDRVEDDLNDHKVRH